MFSETFFELNVTSAMLFFIVLVMSWIWITKSPKNFPPSPGLALPFIGHLHLIGSNPRQRFKQWHQMLGDIFSLKMGSQQIVVLNGFDIIKEALAKQGDSFSGRPVDDFLNANFLQRRRGVIFSSGVHWKSQRSILLKILRDLGVGKNILAEKISEEIQILMEEIDSTKGTPINLNTTIFTSVSNVICSIIFGKRFDKDDPQFVKLVSLLNTINRVFNNVTIIHYWHFLKYVPFDLFRGKKLIHAVSELEEFANNMVEEITLRRKENNSDNLISAYVDAMSKQKSEVGATYLDKVSLARSIDDLFSGGTDATSNTILWCILYSVHYPDIQEKVHKEIVGQVGTNRAPSINDKYNLKYLNAYIMETQRLASIVPFNGPHLCTDDATVGGFFIPRGTTIIPNLDSVHHDVGIWGDPQNFRPERFIDDQGNLKTPEELIPFSIGKRICMGKALGKMELFLFMANLFQKFQFTPVDCHNLPPLVGVFGITAPPVPYEVKCVARKL